MKTTLLSILNVIHSITIGDIIIAIVFAIVFFGLIVLVKSSFAKDTQVIN